MILTKKITISKNATNGLRYQIQKIGSFMAGMILPSIGVIIAWGLWTSMFLYNEKSGAHGWFTGQTWNATWSNWLGVMVGPGIKYLIPLLIAVNAGKMIYGVRGAALSAFMVLVIIVGTDEVWKNNPQIITINGKSLAGRAPNQIIGAMIVGPLSAWLFKKLNLFTSTKSK